LRRLAKTEAGFGLIELLIAMTVMVIAIMAIVAAFSSGMVALNRASHASTAATLADTQMETYRAIRWDSIVLKKTLVDSAATPYASDTALAGDSQNGNYDVTDTLLGPTSTYCNATPTPVTCLPVQSPVTGPGGGSYRIDSYVTWTCAVGTFSPASPPTATPGCGTGGARPSKRVTVVVRDPSTPTTVLFRESSTFDQATG
jgi:type II secretory pathway pseudopilin PulG